MKTILERLQSGKVLVADGAMGTMLFERGLRPGDCPESFNLDRLEVLEEIASLYLEAGADIVQTNTFGGSPLKLANYGLEGRTEDANRGAVEAVRAAVGDRAYVSGSCGPTGEMLAPYGTLDEATMAAAFERQVAAIIGAGADVICVETMTDLREATLAVRAVKAVSPSTPVMATMTFDRIPKGFFTLMGVSVGQAVDGLLAAGADIVGSNCGHGIDAMIEIARQMRALTDRPILIQANAGLPSREAGRLVYPESPSYFGERVPALVDAGASIVGGCCGTRPEHIQAIRDAVDRLRQPRP